IKKIEPVSESNTKASFSPEKMVFGKGSQEEQELKVTVNFENKENIHILKLEIKEETEDEEETESSGTVEENGVPIDETAHLIFQKKISSPAEVRLEKTADELESDLKMLKK